MRYVTKVAALILANALSALSMVADAEPITRGSSLRAMHVGGLWGSNHCFVGLPLVWDGGESACPASDPPGSIPEDFVVFLRRNNVDWVGISVALFYDNVLDNSVDRKHDRRLPIPTYTDEELRALIRAYRAHGFRVLISLAFESETHPNETARLQEQTCGTSAYRPERWQLGDPKMPLQDPCVNKTHWPWDVSHPRHNAFVADFYRSYTAQAVHFATIAQEEGVELYALGTETERLFRTRSGGFWIDHYKPQLQSMVSAVRQVFGGQLTYGMHYSVLDNRAFFGDGTALMWDDLGLDVIGLSAYFRLVDTSPTSVPAVSNLESAWENIFDTVLLPMQRENGGRPMVFTEFGYVDSVSAIYRSTDGESSVRTFVDSNGNQVDDGQETQAIAYQAFYNVLRRKPGIVSGAFLWGHMMASDAYWANGFGRLRGFSVRAKPSESVVRAAYGEPRLYNVQGLWWNAPAGSESGWGINFVHEGEVVFATWFTYDPSGRDWWLTMTATQVADNVYAGKLYETRGPFLATVPFAPTQVTSSEVGSGTLTFYDDSNGVFSYVVNGIAQTKSITRQVFGHLPYCAFAALSDPALAKNYQGLWWAAPAGAESGWGVNFTHQGGTIFVTWFTYDADRRPLWLSATVTRTAGGIYQGAVYRTKGPAFNAEPFDATSVALTRVGTMRLAFVSGNSATLSYTLALDGPLQVVQQSKSIVRQMLRAPGTTCD